LKKMSASGLRARVTAEEATAVPAAAWDDDLWDLMLTVAQSAEILDRAASTLELSLVARQALELTQKFNAVYHKHPVVQETDVDLRTARLTAILVFLRGLETLSGALGIPLPQKM
jgi:arginyl-tRNA synthetase